MIKRLLKGSLFKIFDFLRPLILIPLFIRFYGLDAYGVYIQIILVGALMYPILDLGIGMGIQRYNERLESLEDIIEAFNVQKITIAGFAILFLFLMYFPSISGLLFGKYQSTTIIYTSLIYFIFFALNNTLQGVMRAKSKIDKLLVYRIVFAGVESFLLIIVLFFHNKFDYVYVGLMSLSQIIYFFLLNREVDNIYFHSIRGRIINPNTKSFFKYTLMIIPTAMVGWVTASSDRFFLTNYFGPEYTGYYSAVAQYTGYMKLIVFPFTFIFFKDFGKFYDENFKKFLRFYSKAISLCIFSSILFFVLFYLLRSPIFSQYVGIENKPELSTLTFWFLITFLLVNISSFFSTYLLVSQQTRGLLFSIVAGAVTNIFLNKFFLSDYTYVHAVYYYAASVGIQLAVMGGFIIVNILKNAESSLRGRKIL